MNNWWLPENRAHTIALACAVTLICAITFLHGCASRPGNCALTLVGKNVEYVCNY